MTIFSIAMKLKSKIFIIFSSGTSEEHVSLTDSNEQVTKGKGFFIYEEAFIFLF